MITNKVNTMPLEERTVTLTLPSSDYSYLCSITTQKGWTIVPQPRKRKCGLDRAIEAAKKGPLYSFDNVKDMMKFLNDED